MQRYLRRCRLGVNVRVSNDGLKSGSHCVYGREKLLSECNSMYGVESFERVGIESMLNASQTAPSVEDLA